MGIVSSSHPTSWSMNVNNAQVGVKRMEELWWQGLGAKISHLRLRLDREEMNKTYLDLFSHSVAIQFNVFGSFMEHWIGS